MAKRDELRVEDGPNLLLIEPMRCLSMSSVDRRDQIRVDDYRVYTGPDGVLDGSQRGLDFDTPSLLRR